MSDEINITTADMLEIYASGGNGSEYVDGVALILKAAAELRTARADGMREAARIAENFEIDWDDHRHQRIQIAAAILSAIGETR